MFNDALKQLRLKHDLRQADISRIFNVSLGAVGNWESGKRMPDTDMLMKIANYFEVSVDELLGREPIKPRFDPADNWIPVLGNVAAGIPAEAIESFDSEDPDDWEQIDDAMARNGKHVALRINGSSMEPRMKKGDVVIVRLQPTIEDGEIAIVKVNGDEATCKKIKKTLQGITLVPLNPAYSPIFYTSEECENLPVTIMGKVVELRAKF